jgi:inosine triphosphate pyrophosphatase
MSATACARPIVNFITGNAGKLREVKAILEPAIEVRSRALDIEEIQGTLEEVTEAKCRKAAIMVNGPVLVDDTSLCFAALNGLPGPYIKWFFASLGHEGMVKLLAGYEDKSAEAVCTFGYSAGPGEKPVLFQGSTKVSSARRCLREGGRVANATPGQDCACPWPGGIW